MRNWRVRWRLTALILVPTVAGVALAGARVVASVDTVAAYDRSEVAAQQAGHIRELLQAVALERDTTGWYDLLRGKAKAQLKENVTEARRSVDTLMKTVKSDMSAMDESYGQRVADQVKLAASALPHLSTYRAAKGDPGKYDPLIESLLRLHEELSLINQDPQILGEMRGLSRLAKAKEQISQQRIQLLTASYDESVNAQQVAEFIASRARQSDEQEAFGGEAGGKFAGLLHTTLYVTEYYRAALTKERAVVLAGDKKDTSGLSFRQDLLPDTTQWFNDNLTAITLIRKVEDQVAKAVIDRTRDLRSGEVTAAIVAGSTILVLLLLVLLFTVAVARSMVTPLRRLRTEALEIAGFRLPDVVRKLRVSGDAAPDIQPIAVQGKDEIGEVAQAFDEVHRQAVRLAGEEAELRSNISSMFVNLSRRTQTLVERQISLIDGLEKGEQDGGRLADLFKLDHLATRMRRNSENLLVLAGHEPTRRRSQPAKLVDVVRAALSEVEEYERVQVKVHRSTSVVGSAANDLVHLVAELVENAIQFSPKNSQVTVSSSVIEGGGALLSVSDSGISMTEEELAEANRRLAEPPVVDVSVSRRMGLFVVGRLALRHGIRVQLRRGDGAGLIAMVLLPPVLLPDGTQQQPAPQRPAFGGGTVPAFGAPAQNGAFSSSFDTYDTAGFGADSGPVRPGLGAFNADTGGTPAGHVDTGSYPSFPSMDQQPRPTQDPPGWPLPDQARPPAHDPSGWPSPDQARPAQERPPLPRRETFAAPTAAPPAAGPYNTGSFDSFGSGQFRRPPITEQPPPSVNVSPMEPEPEEYLPIFASVESAWFRRPENAPPSAPSTTPASPASAVKREEEPRYVMPEEQAVPSGGDMWHNAADAGWRAADAAKDPSLGGITSAGLPKRTPKANLVPGTANQPAQQQATPQPPAPPLSADRVRSRLASYQQGVRRGRAEVREQEDQA